MITDDLGGSDPERLAWRTEDHPKRRNTAIKPEMPVD
jgi:hypothetical protein